MWFSSEIPNLRCADATLGRIRKQLKRRWNMHRVLSLLLACALGSGAIFPTAANAQEPESVIRRAVDVSSPEKVLDYLRQHRRDVAFVSYSVKPDGSIDTRNPAVALNANEPMPLASTQKIVILAAYARE